MNLVEAFIELQIAYQVYNGQYNCDRQEVIKNLKALLSYLQLLDISVKSMSCIIDGVLDHPVNLGLKLIVNEDLIDVGCRMLELKEIVLKQYERHRGSKTKGKRKKLKPIPITDVSFIRKAA
jgi:superfamily I DNA/RNA helicase